MPEVESRYIFRGEGKHNETDRIPGERECHARYCKENIGPNPIGARKLCDGDPRKKRQGNIGERRTAREYLNVAMSNDQLVALVGREHSSRVKNARDKPCFEIDKPGPYEIKEQRSPKTLVASAARSIAALPRNWSSSPEEKK